MAINKVTYNGSTLIDLTNDTVAADKLLSGYTAHDKSGALITGTLASGTTPANGSLIICHCSSNITEVNAVYNGITAGADLYTSTHYAYITIPHTFTGTVRVNGYAGGDSAIVSADVEITAPERYTCELKTEALIYGGAEGSKAYNGISEDYDWVSSYDSSSLKSQVEVSKTNFLRFKNGSLSGSGYVVYLSPHISTRCYSKIQITVSDVTSSPIYIGTVSDKPERSQAYPGKVINATGTYELDINADSSGMTYIAYHALSTSRYADISEIKFI